MGITHKFIILVFIIAKTFGDVERNTVLLSQQSGSHDNITCGSKQQPCATFLYAMSRLSEMGGVLIIDGGFRGKESRPYIINISRTTIIINGSITITNRKYIGEIAVPAKVKAVNIPALEPPLRSFAFFLCYGNLSISSVEFQFNLLKNPYNTIFRTFWFKVKVPGEYIEIKDTVFQTLGTIIGDVWNLEMYVSNAKISRLLVYYGYRKKTVFGIKNGITRTLHLQCKQNIMQLYNSVLFAQTIVLREIGVPKTSLSIRNTSFFDSVVEIKAATVLVKNSLFHRKRKDVAAFFRMTEIRKKVIVKRCCFENFPVVVLGTSNTVFYNTSFRNFNQTRENVYKMNIINVLNINCITAIIKNCAFENNFLYFGATPSIKIEVENLIMINVFVLNGLKQNGLDSDMLTMINVRKKNQIPGRIRFLVSNVTIKCFKGQRIHNVAFVDLTLFYSQTLCQKCPISMYSILASQIKYEWNGTEKFEVKCLNCPFGGICNHGIKSKGGYWGFITGQEVTFVQCPPFYCCLTPVLCTSYNTCSSNREGRLCSQCKQGFTTSITSRQECVRNDICGSEIVNVSAYISTTLVYVCFILYLREVVLIFKRLLLTTRERNNSESQTSDVEIDLCERLLPECFERGNYGSRAVAYQLLLHKEVPFMQYKTTSSIMSGSLKILFFFYQAVSTMRVQTSEKFKISFPLFLDIIASIFNVRPDIAYSKYSFCFMRNLQNIHILILRNGYTVLMMSFILLMLLFRKIHQCICKKSRTNENEEETHEIKRIDDTIGCYNKQPFDIRLKCASLQILLIGYAGISTFAFKSVHCININKQLYLFTQASILCYQPWQIVSWVFICIWVLPFPFVMFFSSKQMFECLITPDEFLFILIFPPIFVYKLMKRAFCKRPVRRLKMKEAMLGKHLLIVLNEPFRETQNGARLCWDSVLMLRRAILIVIHIFVVSPIHKILPTVFALLIFLGHHDIMKPYKDKVLNKLEKVCLFLLISLLFVNAFWGFANEYDLFSSEAYRKLAYILLYYELVVLSFPFGVLICAIVGIMGKKLVNLFKIFSKKRD